MKRPTDLKYEKYEKYLLSCKDRSNTIPFPTMKNSLLIESYCGYDPSYNKQWLFRFPNKYGASVVKFWGSYGFDKDLFELAMIKFCDDSIVRIVYEDITNHDIAGYLTNDEVLEYLEKIKNHK